MFAGYNFNIFAVCFLSFFFTIRQKDLKIFSNIRLPGNRKNKSPERKISLSRSQKKVPGKYNENTDNWIFFFSDFSGALAREARQRSTMGKKMK